MEESGSLGSSANSTDPRSFVADQHGEVKYQAFSGQLVIRGSEPSCGTQKLQGECILEDIQGPPMLIKACDGEGKGAIQSLMMKAGNVEKQEHAIVDIPEEECGEVGTKAKNQIPQKEKRTNEKQVMSRLALNATLLGSASTAYFGVNQHICLDWIGMIYIICLTLAIALVILGEHSQRRWMKRWGSYFTRGAIVLTVTLVIAAAVSGKKRGDIRTTPPN